MLTNETKLKMMSVILDAEKHVSLPDEVIPSEIDNYLVNTLEFEKGELETNGWEWDFWLDFTDPKTDKKYELSGSGYCGDYSFSLLNEN